MLLSPLAAPFQPSFEAPPIAIYNDGVPALVGNDSEILHGIQDDALDEFPPSAEEAAELEAVEIFVDILATLSILEEREEKARASFCHVQKRWEARREDGLLTKPRPAKNLVETVDHVHVHVGKPIKTTDLIPFDHLPKANAAALLETRQRAREDARVSNRAEKKVGRLNQPRPLHQPRKQS